MTYHPSLLTPQTRQKDIDSRAAVPQTFEMSLEAACIAYHRTDLEVAYYGTKQPNPDMQKVVRATRDRKLIDLRPLLEKLVVQKEAVKILKKIDATPPAYPPELLTARRAAFIAQIETSSPAANRAGQASE